MQRFARTAGLFLCLLLCFLLAVVVSAEENIIDVNHASDGYFSVCYSSPDSQKLKVGVTFGGKTVYYDYVSGKISPYAFVQGDGAYTISLYENVGGIRYKKITSETVSVKLVDSLVPYIVSANEVTFSQDDIVTTTACEICDGLTDVKSKVIVIHDFVYENISYDYAFAADVMSGKIKTYIPNAADILTNKKGVCYDSAVLFAAMCRSQGIPCSVEKGYYQNVYHAWNKVYMDGTWYHIDATVPLSDASTSEKFNKFN